MNSSSLQLDPLNSPHPVPWNWVMAMLSDRQAIPRIRYYRSPSLISPDGKYAAYSRIQMTLAPEIVECRVGSVLFLENLETGSLQTIAADSPLSGNPFMSEATLETPGTIAILIPVGWSADSDRLLSREFESLFCSSIASDYAIVWDRHANEAQTLAPIQVNYSNAILLGWSQTYPDRVLFHTGMMGDPVWSVYAVAPNGTTDLAPDDQAIVFGEVADNLWSGPQAAVRSA